jgi:hypothetical protein
MEWIFEDSVPTMIVGGLTAAILGGGWIQTGRKWLLYLMIAAIALTVALVIVERLVVTPREQVKATLFEIARLVADNELQAAVDYAYSGSPHIRDMALAELSRYHFHSVDIKRNLTIAVFPDHDPPRATADFNVVVSLDTRDGFLQERRIPRFVEVTLLREEDGQWRVSNYAHDVPQRGWTTDDQP